MMSGNQTWQWKMMEDYPCIEDDGRLSMYRWFTSQNLYLQGISNCHVWYPEGMSIDILCGKPNNQ